MTEESMTEHQAPIRFTIDFDPNDTRHVVQMYAVVCSQGDWSSDLSEDAVSVFTDHSMHVQLTGHKNFFQFKVERGRGADVSDTFNRKRR